MELNYPVGYKALTLITCCKKFFKDEYKEEGRNFVFNNLPIIADSALMYRLWLPKASKITDNMPALSLARIVHTAQQENEIFYQKFKTAIKDFEEYGNITLDDLSETYSSKLFEITARNADGNYENFTEEILAQSLEEFITIQTNQKDKEINKLKIQVKDKSSENEKNKEDLIEAYTRIYTNQIPIVCKVFCVLSKFWWLFSAILVVAITQVLNLLPINISKSTIGLSWILSLLLLIKPFIVKVIDKIINKKVDVVTQYFKRCAQKSFINNFDKKSNKKEQEYKDVIIERGFAILKIDN